MAWGALLHPVQVSVHSAIPVPVPVALPVLMAVTHPHLLLLILLPVVVPQACHHRRRSHLRQCQCQCPPRPRFPLVSHLMRTLQPSHSTDLPVPVPVDIHQAWRDHHLPALLLTVPHLRGLPDTRHPPPLFLRLAVLACQTAGTHRVPTRPMRIVTHPRHLLLPLAAVSAVHGLAVPAPASAPPVVRCPWPVHTGGHPSRRRSGVCASPVTSSPPSFASRTPTREGRRGASRRAAYWQALCAAACCT